MNDELQKALDELRGFTSTGNIEPIVDETEQLNLLEMLLGNDNSDASAVVTVSPDNMTAKLVLKEPSSGGQPVTYEIIEKAIREQGITNGIKTEYINRLISFCVYDKSFIIAEGQPPINGDDEHVEFLLDIIDNLSPNILADGSATYNDLGSYESVESGEKLGIIHPPTKGEKGFDIFGNEILNLEGQKLTTPPNGTNTIIADDNITIVSTVSGRVSFKNNKIDVRHEKLVDKVDATTGNILFEGDVTVRGDVLEGFEIKCGGDINVGGVVENALLISGGDIIVAKGIHGENCKAFSEGGIRSYHIESATLNCKGSIYADYILNAETRTGDKLYLNGDHGYILGGYAVAQNGIEAKSIGNSANILTTVEVLKPQDVNPEISILTEKVENYKAEIDKLTKAWQNASKMPLSKEEKRKYTETITLQKKKLTDELGETTIELDRLEIESANQEVEPLIIVKEKLYSNVIVKVDGLETKNKTSRTKCNVSVYKGNIEFV